ncbi:MAG: lipoate--protein ligase [Syntrophomonadaceae bacterium]|nr:lipoate--protein ligase [Syntrophomonadaceae bacterium]
MLEIINPETDPYYNLALEEHCLQHFDDQDILILWQNVPTVVIGRNQNTLEEINLAYVKEKDIKVVRRLSGGGAVYHDPGNLNFTFIVNDTSGLNRYDFTRFTHPVIKALDKIGIKAEDNGRNDITIGGKKFSGNAQYRQGKRLLHHGTILFDCNLEEMVRALNVSQEKIISKGVKSVRSRVTNIAEHLHEPMNIKLFKEILTQTVFAGQKHEQYKLDGHEREAVLKLKENKYSTWNFIYGSSPPFNVVKKAQFEWGNIKVHLNIKKGLIEDCAIYGDFFAGKDIAELACHLRGIKYQESSLKACLETIDITSFIPSAKREEILELFIK